MTRIYHFTHLENLASIIEAGGLRCDSSMPGHDYANVGHRDIKSRRLRQPVFAPPGGVVADYVPFYFAPRSPMLYVIHKGTVPGCSSRQSEVAYLVASAEDVATVRPCCFSDRNAAKSFAGFYSDLDQMRDVIDWPLMQADMWNNTPDDLERMERRMAEFLVHEFFPWNLVQYIAVYDQDKRAYARTILVRQNAAVPVRIERDWYF